MLSSLRPSLRYPIRLPLLHFHFKCSAPDISFYRESFARRMALAGVKPHHRIALGVSGGPDSMALCVLTAGWKSEGLRERGGSSSYIDGLLGIVVDHRLRPESVEEARIVQERVTKMGIKCEISCCNWPEGRPKLGDLQKAAREMRYQKFQDICAEQQIGLLLVAHHADDQAELFILRLSRNSGVFGLAGMAFVSQLFLAHASHSWSGSNNHGVLLIRPMLEFSKVDMYEEGYSIIDLEKLDPSKVDDLCLSKFLVMILQLLGLKGQKSLSATLLNHLFHQRCSYLTFIVEKVLLYLV